ncbi:MAG TPA: hypothetical protein VGO25_02010 [Rhodanobacteraceae bacterium]|jgi:hypothetical protein|nr:hypothetical protein [Rhodanobacteraceae bacterium]
MAARARELQLSIQIFRRSGVTKLCSSSRSQARGGAAPHTGFGQATSVQKRAIDVNMQLRHRIAERREALAAARESSHH